MSQTALNEWINQASLQEKNGKKLSQLSLETYLIENLDLKIIDVKETEVNYEEAFELIATNGTNEYLFLTEYYQPESFNPIQNVLILKEIRGVEGVYKTHQHLYLQNDNTPQNKYLHTPLSELIKGEDKDAELLFVVNYLQESLKLIEGYVYKEKKENDIHSFRIKLNDNDVVIGQGFQNTIQFQFEKKKFNPFQIIFSERNRLELTKELDTVVEFIKNYLTGSIMINEHCISELYDFLEKEKLYPSVNAKVLLQEDDFEEANLFNKMVLGEWDTYHQLEISIGYQKKTNRFNLKVNYLFKVFETTYATTSEIKEEIKTLLPLFRTT